jgi:signal-transduction protein with cAMP-binding, CBS, and nucleotidyltransferase domain
MAEPGKIEPWLQWMALTTTVLAVAAAISSLRASSYSTKVQIHTAREANHWAYFQSKSIKELNFTPTRDILAGIHEVISPIRAIVDADDPVVKTLYLMTKENVSPIPVMKENKVVGMIRLFDLVREISEVVSDHEIN